MYLVLLLLLSLATAPAHGHLVGSEEASRWPDPIAVVLLLLAAACYWFGSRRQARPFGATKRRRKRCFWAGWFALVVALGSPIDPLGEELFSIHMVQHEMLMLIAAPLLVASRPSGPLLRGLPRAAAQMVGKVLRLSGLGLGMRWCSRPVVAWFIHLLGLWGWHLPLLFNAGLRSTWVHSLQHLTFLWVALVFWYALMRPQQSAAAANILYLFTTAVHASLLGALLTFAPSVWYTPYLETAPAWGLSALEDQQLGGLIMWVPGGVVFVAAGLLFLAKLLRPRTHTQPVSGERI